MANMSSLAIPSHKKMAMGLGEEEIPMDTSAGWPGRFQDERHHDQHIVRGVGRAPDAKKSGMPKCDPERAVWMDLSASAEAGDGVKVREHVRGKPNLVGKVA